MMKKAPSARLREARLMRGFASAADAARRFGWPVSTYRSDENGTRGLSSSDVMMYARAFGVAPEWLLGIEKEPTTEGVPVIADAAVGVWRDKSLDEERNKNRRLILVPRSGGVGMRFAVRVTDDSVNKLVPSGAFVVCTPWEAGHHLERGRYVYIEHTRGDLVERSVRIVDGSGESARLRTSSTHAKFANSLPATSDGVRIIGLVVGGYFEV